MEPDLNRQAAALNMMQAGIGSLSGNTINQPTPFDNAKSNYIFGSNTPGHAISQQNRWEKAGGKGPYPVMNDTTYSSIMNYDPTNPYSSKAPFRQDQNPPFYSLGDFRYRGNNPAFNPGGNEPWELYNRDIDTSFRPGWMNAGITNSNLGGAKVMNALSIDPTADDFFLRELYNYGKRYFPGYDAEQDEWRHKQYRDSLEEDYQEEVSVDDDNIAVQTLAGQGFSMDEIEQIMADRELQQMAGMDDSWQYLQQQMDELNPDSPNYDDMLEMLMNDMEMKYPYIVS